MNKISGEDLQRLADMTRLCFGEEEKEAMMRALDDILTMMEQLREVNLNGIDELAHVGLQQGRGLLCRDDVAKPGWPPDELLKNAPQSENGCFKVPKVIE